MVCLSPPLKKQEVDSKHTIKEINKKALPSKIFMYLGQF